MHFIVGLGNPGSEYQHSRHNVGWMMLDFLQQKWKMSDFTVQKKLLSEVVKDETKMLIKPQTFMNKSGEAVVKVLNWHDENAIENSEFEHLFVVHDDLDLELGAYKIKFGSGPKIHNGINSVRKSLGSDQFWYIRIGVDARNGDRRIPGQNYVLTNFTAEESEILQKVFSLIDQRLKDLMKS